MNPLNTETHPDTEPQFDLLGYADTADFERVRDEILGRQYDPFADD